MSRVLAIALVLALPALCSPVMGQIGNRPLPGADLFGDNGLRDFGSGNYELNYRRDSTYVYQVPDEQSNWAPTARKIYTYDPSGRLLQTFGAVMSSLNKWKPHGRDTFEYDAAGNPLIKKSDIWQADSSAYVPNSRERYTYVFDGLPGEVRTEVWRGGDWKAVVLNKLLYNAAHLLRSETWYKNDTLDDDAWLPKLRKSYEYNTAGDLATLTMQAWNSSQWAWRNLYSEVYVYNSENRLVETLFRTWDSEENTWFEREISPVEFDSTGLVQSTQGYTTSLSSGMAELNARQVEFDPTGNPESTTISVWQGSAWVPVEKQVHYWSKTFGNGDRNIEPLRCFFPNPCPTGALWRCVGMKRNAAYVLDVFDLAGRHLYSQPLPDDGLFRIEREFKPGLYIVGIHGGLDSHSEKVYFRR